VLPCRLFLEKKALRQFSSDFVTVRSPYTSRTNIRYSVFLSPLSNPNLISILHKCLNSPSSSPIRGIIFVKSKAACGELADFLKIQFPTLVSAIYHSEVLYEVRELPKMALPLVI
jgi:superfamily II DNA helicase RecQ